MKKILITGKNSYIGGKFKQWVEQWPEEYEVDEISVYGDQWKAADFSFYDIVFHVAGIAHRKETKKNRDLYYKVNCDLAVEVTEKAKADGVKQFIFLSTMSVYGLEQGEINKNTPTNPKNAYGKSKLEAEKLIQMLETEDFKVVILRPPMVYGEGCKGNYQLLKKFALITPIFPDFKNKRSMIYIDNLSEFIKKIIDNEKKGSFFPQNDEYMNTSEIVKMIAKSHGKNIKLTKILNPFINLFLIMNISVINKVFGNLIYLSTISNLDTSYQIFKKEDSVLITERAKI